jgi:phosphoenolpyruvate-protein kinase (PTS system EI component)
MKRQKEISIDKAIIHEGMALGKAIVYNGDEINHDYTDEELNGIYDSIEDFIAEERVTYSMIGDRLIDRIYGTEVMQDYIWAPIGTKEFKAIFKRLVFRYRLNITMAFREAFRIGEQHCPEWMWSSYQNNLPKLRKERGQFLSRMLIRIDRLLLQKQLEDIDYDVILVVNEFRKEHLFRLNKRVKAIVSQYRAQIDHIDYSVVQIFEMPLIFSDEQIKNGDRILIDTFRSKLIINPSVSSVKDYRKLVKKYLYPLNEKPSFDRTRRKVKFFAPTISGEHIDRIAQGSWYDGVCLVRTEYLYVTKGAIPTIQEQTEIYTNIIKKMNGREVYFRIPDFRPQRPTPFIDPIYTDNMSFFTYLELFNQNLIAIAKASVHGPISIIVPMIRMESEVLEWRGKIEEVFEHFELPLPRIGFMFETESAMERYEHYFNMDFAVIGLNDFIEEVDEDHDRYEHFNKKEFFDTYYRDVADVHQHFRLSNIEHFVAGNILSQPEVLDRFLKMGYRNIVIPVTKMRRLEPTIAKFIANKGRYIGVAEQREKDKQAALKQKAESERSC